MYLTQTKSPMINRVNKKREHVHFFLGDLVLVNAANWSLPHNLTSQVQPQVLRPIYRTTKQINIYYKLQLRETSKIHDVFHFSLLFSIFIQMKRGVLMQPITYHVNESPFKDTTRRRRRRYLIKWQWQALAEDLWVTEEVLWQVGLEWLMKPLNCPHS